MLDDVCATLHAQSDGADEKFLEVAMETVLLVFVCILFIFVCCDRNWGTQIFLEVRSTT